MTHRNGLPLIGQERAEELGRQAPPAPSRIDHDADEGLPDVVPRRLSASPTSRRGSGRGRWGQGRPKAQPIGPSRGGPTIRFHALVDVLGRPGVLPLTPGNAGHVGTTPNVLADVAGGVRRLIADRGGACPRAGDWLRAGLREKGIPGTRARKRKVRYDRRRYCDR